MLLPEGVGDTIRDDLWHGRQRQGPDPKMPEASPSLPPKGGVGIELDNRDQSRIRHSVTAMLLLGQQTRVTRPHIRKKIRLPFIAAMY